MCNGWQIVQSKQAAEHRTSSNVKSMTTSFQKILSLQLANMVGSLPEEDIDAQELISNENTEAQKNTKPAPITIHDSEKVGPAHKVLMEIAGKDFYAIKTIGPQEIKV